MLNIIVTSRVGVPLARLVDYSGGLVEVPYNDSSTAEVTVSMHSQPALFAKPLKYMLKVIWDQHLVFWGPITATPKNYGMGTVTLMAHDPSWWWKFAFLRYGDEYVNTGDEDADIVPMPLNAIGLRGIAQAAIPSEEQLERNVKHPGIVLEGYDGTEVGNPLFSADDLSNPAENPDGMGGVLWVKGRERGSGVFETAQSMTESIFGVDYYLRPIDAEHLTTEVTSWTEGYFAQLDVWKAGERGRDLTLLDEAPAFHFGWGADTLADMSDEADAAQMVNYAVLVEESGQKGEADVDAIGAAHNEASWQEYGIMQSWGGGDEGDQKPQLTAKAKQIVKAYAEPPPYFTVVPKSNHPNAPLWLRDFDLADTIQAVAKRGNCTTDVVGRIVKVSLTQTDAAGNTATVLECRPRVGDGEFGDGDEA